MNEEQKALLIKARRSLESAKNIYHDGDYDFSISRAYYAMFYLAETFLSAKGLQFSKHSAVISAFGRDFVKTGIVPPQFHRYLLAAQTARLTGDYEPFIQMTEEEAEELLVQTEEFLVFAEHYLANQL